MQVNYDDGQFQKFAYLISQFSYVENSLHFNLAEITEVLLFYADKL